MNPRAMFNCKDFPRCKRKGKGDGQPFKLVKIERKLGWNYKIPNLGSAQAWLI